MLMNQPNADDSIPASLTDYRKLPEAFIIRPQDSTFVDQVFLQGVDGLSGSVDVTANVEVHYYTIENPMVQGEMVDVIVIDGGNYVMEHGKKYTYRVTTTDAKVYYTEVFEAHDLGCNDELVQIEWRNDCFYQNIDYGRIDRLTHKLILRGIPSRPQPINELEVETDNKNKRRVVSRTADTLWRLQTQMTIDELEAIGHLDGHSQATLTRVNVKGAIEAESEIVECSVVSTDFEGHELMPIVTLELRLRQASFDNSCCEDFVCDWSNKSSLSQNAPNVSQSGSAPNYTLNFDMAASNFSPLLDNSWIEMQTSIDLVNWISGKDGNGDVIRLTPAELEAGSSFTFSAFPGYGIHVRVVLKTFNCEYPSEVSPFQFT